MKVTILITACLLLSRPAEAAEAVAPADPSLWRNPDKPIAERVQALMSQLTMKEKFSLIYWKAPAIERLGINAYDHGDEALHGLIRPGNNTVFPEVDWFGSHL